MISACQHGCVSDCKHSGIGIMPKDERRKTKDERRQRGLLFASIVDAKLALEALREHGITTAAHCTSITEFVEIACSALLW